jgi:diacylglycerol kinase family enzyme
MKHYVLYNPIAGHGDSAQKAKQLTDWCQGELVAIDITTIANYADFFATLETDDTVILCGGDGTLNRFINDTASISFPNDVLYYAIGSGNDFLRDVEKPIGADPFSVKEYMQNLPVVEVNGKRYRFLNNVGFGIDGYCCQVGDEMKASSDKPVNYTSIAIKGLLFHFKPANATVTVDGTEYSYRKVWIAPTMKGRYYGGGMMPTPKQDRNDPDGTLSLMLFHGSSKLKTLMVFPSLFQGEHIKHQKIVSIHTGKDITVTFDRPTALQIDGETVLGVTSYHAMAKVPAQTKTEAATV